MRLFIIFFLLTSACVRAVATPGEDDYISRLRQAVAEWQREIPSLDASAAVTAKSLVSGGHLYFVGTQKNFAEEACGRSGGLALCQGLTRVTHLQPDDTVLIGAISSNPDAELSTLLDRIKISGAHMILFSNSHRPDLPGLAIFPVKKFRVNATAGPDIESLGNIAGLWAWIGQVATHCIRLGKMPCFYESISMPGGTVRDQLLRNIPFHAYDAPAAMKVSDLGNLYLKMLDASLEQLAKKNVVSFHQAAQLILESHKRGQQVDVISIGHMFPEELAANPVPAWVVPAPAKFVPTAETLSLYLGYQWFPWEIPELTGAARVPGIVVSSHPPTPDWTVDTSHIYIDPCWEVQDATVDIPGYDIQILPISGIMQSAVFWELVEQVSTVDH